MAKLQKRSSGKGEIPKISDVQNNLDIPEEQIKPMSFKVPLEFNRRFKQFALDNDMSLTDLFKQSFIHYASTSKSRYS